MKNKAPAIAAFACLLNLFCICIAAAETSAPAISQAELRGYGKVSVQFAPERAIFTCETPEKADVLLGKLLADLFWDSDGRHQQKAVNVHGTDAQIHLWPPYGGICAFRDKNQIHVIGSDTEAGLLAQLQVEPSLQRAGAAHFEPAKPYPMYLDFYDLKSFRVYTHPMDSAKKLGLDSHWPFIKQFGLGGIGFQGVANWGRTPAESILLTTDADFEVREAERNGGITMPCPGAGEVALWAYNKHPSRMKQPSPTALIGGWGGARAAGAHYESAGIPSSVNAKTVAQAMKRYIDSPAVGGWHPYAGSPGGEMGLHERTGDRWDYSPAGQEGFRKWLREVKGYTLESLGKAWRKDPAAYKSWDDVEIPDALAFYGNADGKSMRLDGRWYWEKAGMEDIAPPASNDPKWVSFEMAPSQKQMFFPWGDAFYKTEFDATTWRSTNSGPAVHLVCSPWIRTTKDFRIWLNGESVGVVKGTGIPDGFSIEIGKRLVPGRNELILRIPSGDNPDSEGKILGPVYLAAQPPHNYPNLGRQANTRYVDLREWQTYTVYQTHLPVMESARAIDPDRGMILSPGSSLSVANYANELAVRFGLGLQHTGREAWYHPWWAGYGFVAGFYGTSEPSGTARGDKLTRMLGWILFDGDSSHTLYWDIEDYILEEQTNGWFTRNKRNIQLFGKYLREKPDLVLLRTAKNALLHGQETQVLLDAGRGELQCAHFDNVYATERELSLGLLRDYPVLMDCGNEIFDEKMTRDLTRWVEEGGTFIALQNTGLHSELEADVQPLAALSGFTVAAKGKLGKIRFEKDIPILKDWDGREFDDAGIAMPRPDAPLDDYDRIVAGWESVPPDSAKNDPVKKSGLALTAIGEGARTVARWEDGTTAVGYRKVGRGAVIVLGSTFWRNGRDLSGGMKSSSEIEQAFFERLFADLGVKRNATASNPSIWARKFHTKNGLQDWLIAFNSTASPVKSAVSFRLPARPGVLWNMQTKQPVDFAAGDDGWVTLKDVEIAGHGVAVFAARRAGLVGGLPDWWAEKTTYWKRCETSPAADLVEETADRSQPPATINIETWDFLADRDEKVSATSAWKGSGFAQSAEWKPLPAGPWNYQRGDLKDYTGIGLYRAKVMVPPEWSGKVITLNLYSWNTHIASSEAEFFLNGKPITRYEAKIWNQTLNYDVTGSVHPGENILAVRVKGARDMSGILGNVWLQPEVKAREELSLGGDWKVTRGDYLQTESAWLPGMALGKYISREFDIPLSWKGNSVWLHVETPHQWLGSVLVNGRPINYNGYLHPFGLRAEINISLVVRPGEKNTIELWPFSTIPWKDRPYPNAEGRDGLAEASMNIVKVTLKNSAEK